MKKKHTFVCTELYEIHADLLTRHTTFFELRKMKSSHLYFEGLHKITSGERIVYYGCAIRDGIM